MKIDSGPIEAIVGEHQSVITDKHADRTCRNEKSTVHDVGRRSDHPRGIIDHPRPVLAQKPDCLSNQSVLRRF